MHLGQVVEGCHDRRPIVVGLGRLEAPGEMGRRGLEIAGPARQKPKLVAGTGNGTGRIEPGAGSDGLLGEDRGPIGIRIAPRVARVRQELRAQGVVFTNGVERDALSVREPVRRLPHVSGHRRVCARDSEPLRHPSRPAPHRNSEQRLRNDPATPASLR